MSCQAAHHSDFQVTQVIMDVLFIYLKQLKMLPSSRYTLNVHEEVNVFRKCAMRAGC